MLSYKLIVPEKLLISLFDGDEKSIFNLKIISKRVGDIVSLPAAGRDSRIQGVKGSSDTKCIFSSRKAQQSALNT